MRFPQPTDTELMTAINRYVKTGDDVPHLRYMKLLHGNFRALLDSELVYAGQGHCFALARFGDPQDADILADYLPRLDCHYDQHWAIGALMHLDERHGTDRAAAFTCELWQHSAVHRLDPAEWRAELAELCAFADTWMSPAPAARDTHGHADGVETCHGT